MYDLFNSIIIQKRNDIGCVSFLDVTKEDVLKILHFYMFSGDWETFLAGLSEVWKHNAHFLVKEAWECVFRRNISLDEIKDYKAE